MKVWTFNPYMALRTRGLQAEVVWMAVGCAVVTALLVAPAAAYAQAAADEDAQSDQGTSDPESRRERAREVYSRGQTLFNQGKHVRAARTFQQAYDIYALPVVMVAVAEAWKAAGNAAGAADAYETYLKRRPDAPDRSYIESEIRRLRETPATVRITSDPAGASIEIDGEGTEETTPAELQVERGQHVVAVQLDGYRDASREIEVDYGEELDIELDLESVEPAEPEPSAETPEPSAETPAAPGSGSKPGTQRRPEDRGGEIPTGVWIAGGVTAAGVIAGAVLGGLAVAEHNDFQDTPTQDGKDKGELLSLLADVSFGVAGAAAVTGIVIYFVASGDEESQTAELELVPTVGPSGGGAAVQGRF